MSNAVSALWISVVSLLHVIQNHSLPTYIIYITTQSCFCYPCHSSHLPSLCHYLIAPQPQVDYSQVLQHFLPFSIFFPNGQQENTNSHYKTNRFQQLGQIRCICVISAPKVCLTQKPIFTSSNSSRVFCFRSEMKLIQTVKNTIKNMIISWSENLICLHSVSWLIDRWVKSKNWKKKKESDYFSTSGAP